MPKSPRDAVARLSRELQLAADGRPSEPGHATGPDRRAAPEAAGRRHLWGRATAAWKAASAFALTLGGVLLLGALLVLLGQELLRRTVSIEPISVPKTLAEHGYTDRVAAARLRDAIRAVIARAYEQQFRSDILLHAEAPEIVVPRLGIPLEAIAGAGRTLFGARRWRSVSGEFVERDGRLWLRLRINGRDFYSAPDSVEADNPDAAMQTAALAVLGATSPSLVATWFAASDPDSALALSARIVQELPESSPDVIWAYVLTGNILLERNQRLEAEKVYREAIRADPSNRFAHNNLGYALYPGAPAR